MPARLHPSIAPQCRSSFTQTSISTFLLPFFHLPTITQTRSASILGAISDVPGSYNKKIRRGRGPSSGKGKTSGRGHKGQGQHGKVPAGFQGGQTPLEVVKGERGFENLHSLDMTTVNIDRIQSWIDQGRIDASKPITVKELQESRCLHGVKDGVKLLARNPEELRSPIHITVSRASATAIAAIEAIGGSVQTRYYTKSSIRNILRGLSHPTLSRLSPPALKSESGGLPATPLTSSPLGSSADIGPPKSYKYRLPDPSSRKDMEYYRDPAHRGYLAYQVPEGQGPSLFFRTPRTIEQGAAMGKKKERVSAADGQGAKTERIF